MPSKNNWDRTFIQIAFDVSELSKDPSTKVGAVIVSPDNRKFSFGYNGFARKLKETKEMWNNRDLKHELVVHAEINAILNTPFDTTDCKIYVTHQPCHRCLIHIINSGIKEVYYSEPYLKLGFKDIIKKHIPLLKVYKRIKNV